MHTHTVDKVLEICNCPYFLSALKILYGTWKKLHPIENTQLWDEKWPVCLPTHRWRWRKETLCAVSDGTEANSTPKNNSGTAAVIIHGSRLLSWCLSNLKRKLCGKLLSFTHRLDEWLGVDLLKKKAFFLPLSSVFHASLVYPVGLWVRDHEDQR